MASVGRWAVREFKMAFGVMSVIPICITVYVLTAKLFTIEILEGATGLLFLFVIAFSLLGFFAGRRALYRVLEKLVDAHEGLQRHETMKSSFIANVAYELRPPLSAVQMSLKNIADGLLGPLTDSQRQTVQECHGIVGRLTRMANELLEVTGFGGDKPTLRRDVFTLQEVIRQAMQDSQTPLTEHRLTVTSQLPDEEILYFGDRAKIRQAVASLLDHAIRWSSDGGVVIVELSAQVEEWRLTVSHGIAGSKSDLAKALDTFKRLGGDIEPHMGLGLRLAHEIAEMHHGRFWMEGEPGHASRLYLSLPALEPASRGSTRSVT